MDVKAARKALANAGVILNNTPPTFRQQSAIHDSGHQLGDTRQLVS
jgi:hypothetical protein